MNVRDLFVQNYWNNRFRLIGIFGNLGSAKTALAVVIVRMLQGMYGLPVVGNLGLKLPNARRYDISELVGLDFYDTIVVGDEIYTQADARCSMSMQNVYYSYFVAQARKTKKKRDGSRGVGNFVVYTAQLQSMADLRLFELSNLYIMMSPLESGDFEMEWVNDMGLSGGGVVPCEYLWREAVPFYDTDERIMPFQIQKMQVEMEMQIPEKINKRIDLVVEDMLKKYEWKGWRDVQQFTVRDYLVRVGVPDRLCLAVWNRLRERVRVGV